nr:DNA-binding transcriptional repressor PuuR [Streptococcus thermophilus]
MTAEEIGQRVVNARRQARLTQVQLAELAGLSDRTVREIEHGSGSPALGSVLEVLDVLGLEIEVR